MMAFITDPVPNSTKIARTGIARTSSLKIPHQQRPLKPFFYPNIIDLKSEIPFFMAEATWSI